MNRKVYQLSAALMITAGALFYLRLSFGGQSIRAEFDQHLWRVEIGMTPHGAGTRASFRLTLPADNERQTIYNENFENSGLSFAIQESKLTKNRMGRWQAQILDGAKSVKYIFSAQLKSQTFEIPPDLRLDPTIKDRLAPEDQLWLKPSEYIQSDDKKIKSTLRKAIGREKRVEKVMHKLFDFVRGKVQYRSEQGSKDALETLKQLTADCGGQARVMVALSRAAGIPSRVVGGLLLEPGVKQITHVWIENYIGGKWIPFDTVNNHFASIPNHYLELYKGDVVLLRHSGLAKIDYYFNVGFETMPPVDQPWSLYILPVHFHGITKMLLLIPLGTLIVALTRIVLGIPTFGTFGPILLAIAFEEVLLVPGLLFVALVLSINCLVRRLLDHLKILIIPKLSILVTTVVLILISVMMLSVHFGQLRILYVSAFPIIIMTWMTERFSVLQIEDGTMAAVKSSLGTVVVAILAYLVMDIPKLRSYFFAFPELLLVNIAVLLLLGRYTGIRLTELWRFRDLHKLHDTRRGNS
ncbi:MAG: hypothetical protein A2Y02_01275 [Omnitrophica bacterium GWA2_52_12]|nr:MAG: hypothetical protein A2Y02_01275 [Omnitrophica bacterium GWA2_52_12]